ncbi:transposase [Colwellia echini]|uniref:Transposase n=1 Tax=Colwellia echini TaxID=1982103 RepID=A0ABY3MZ30_9GAMM|nr:transposase [Colwellia echini]
MANIVLYDYHDIRAPACPVDYFAGYAGYLHFDGYQVYERTQATLVGCWAHVPGKFIDA